jgi:hypothetical protein
MLLGIISKLYKIQGTNIIKAITIGNNIVQQNDINWSKRILGKLALAHINVKTIIHVLNPKIVLHNIPSTKGLDKNESKYSLYKNSSVVIYWIK